MAASSDEGGASRKETGVQVRYDATSSPSSGQTSIFGGFSGHVIEFGDDTSNELTSCLAASPKNDGGGTLLQTLDMSHISFPIIAPPSGQTAPNLL